MKKTAVSLVLVGATLAIQGCATVTRRDVGVTKARVSGAKGRKSKYRTAFWETGSSMVVAY